jgi:low affinity Fe/Cu permease
MTTALWIALGIAAVFVLGYVLAMRNLHRKSREIDKQIDYSKIRKWKDEEK